MAFEVLNLESWNLTHKPACNVIQLSSLWRLSPVLETEWLGLCIFPGLAGNTREIIVLQERDAVLRAAEM